MVECLIIIPKVNIMVNTQSLCHKEAKMAKKEKGMKAAEKTFKEKAEARARKSQQERVGFVQEFGKAISAAWAKLGDKANVLAVAKTMPKEKVRLVHYALVSLGLLETKDGGLINWMKADSALAHTAGTPAPRKGKGKHEAA